MRIRFLQTCPSANPDVPFQAGQVIDVAEPSPELLELLDGVQAVVLPSDDSERAIEPDAEQPEPSPMKGRRRERL